MARPKIKNPRKVKSVRVPIELQHLDLTWIITEMEIAYSKIEREKVEYAQITNTLGTFLVSQLKFCANRNRLLAGGRNSDDIIVH